MTQAESVAIDVPALFAASQRSGLDRLADGLIAAARAARPLLAADPETPKEALVVIDAFLQAADPAGAGRG